MPILMTQGGGKPVNDRTEPLGAGAREHTPRGCPEHPDRECGSAATRGYITDA